MRWRARQWAHTSGGEHGSERIQAAESTAVSAYKRWRAQGGDQMIGIGGTGAVAAKKPVASVKYRYPTAAMMAVMVKIKPQKNKTSRLLNFNSFMEVRPTPV